jgi:hypothetical protein
MAQRLVLTLACLSLLILLIARQGMISEEVRCGTVVRNAAPVLEQVSTDQKQ